MMSDHIDQALRLDGDGGVEIDFRVLRRFLADVQEHVEQVHAELHRLKEEVSALRREVANHSHRTFLTNACLGSIEP